MQLVRWLPMTIVLLMAGTAFAAETSADKFKKIMPAINFLLLGGETVEIYNVYADHLNTPRLITNQANQAVWRYDNNDPFGGNTPDENPSGLGAFEFPLRDEGTYADKETNLIYNWNRYRDPLSGRFIQADPLGLAGGDLSLYALRKNNPLIFTDPRGLQQFPVPTSGTSGVQQAGARAMACALNPAACNPPPPPSCTCSSPQGPDPNVAGQIIGGSMLTGATTVGIAGGIAGLSIVSAEAAHMGALGGLVVADAIASGAIGGAVVGGAVGAIIGVGIAGGYYYYATTRSNSCNACCP
jgi:RHS repeat-associated protein